WWMRRIREGACAVVNPFNPRQVSHVSLRPEHVDAIVFWTRNAAPLLPYLAELNGRGYRYYFQYTLTGYNSAIEPNVPEVANVVTTLTQLAAAIGPERICWRYDPILFTNTMPPEYHLEHFAALASALRGLTQHVTVSLFDEYRGAMRRLRELAPAVQLLEIPETSERFAHCMRTLASIAEAQGMAISSCAETVDLRPYGIMPGQCIDGAYLRRVFGIEVATAKDPNQRAACGCVASKDIGAYDTCLHGCRYCYATHRDGLAAARHAAHGVESPALLPMEPRS
ncbi:MAG TPA: DUF1848 domain-containing protein, partial [Armatimonadota bacterium]